MTMKRGTRFGIQLTVLLAAGLLLACSGDSVESEAGPVSIETYRGWMQEISNWGRWGEDDELGTLNPAAGSP